jgi:hypothetical protein
LCRGISNWPDGAAEPDHYWLPTLPPDIDFARMADLTKLRWRIERDYLDLKQEGGLGHNEGRGWRGFHHYASLHIATCGFLISGRETPPQRTCPRPEPPAICRSRRLSTQRIRRCAHPSPASCPDVHAADISGNARISGMSDAVELGLHAVMIRHLG